MNFSEIVSEVIGITRRPDLTTRIQAAVKEATLKIHQTDFYYPDIQELTIQFDNPDYISNFNPFDIATRFRKAKYMRIWDGDAVGFAGPFIEPTQVENVLDDYGINRTNVFYQAGQLLQIRTCLPLDKILFGFYQQPNIESSAYSSWIANVNPYIIVNEAARRIFAEIGMESQANQLSSLVAEGVINLRVTYIDTIPVT